ncbi:MurR/RpiR family transcriptional regulator [Desulforhopalus sp. 52FAK]
MLKKEFLLKKTPLPKLTASQNKILEYLLDHPDDVAYMSSGQLAASLGMSNATIVRFCQHIGFKGYMDLQRHIRQEIKTRLSVPQRLQKQPNNIVATRDFIKTVLKSDQENLAVVAKTLSSELFEQLVTDIQGRQEIWVLGLRSCHGAAHYFSTNLRFLSRRVNLITLDAGTVWSQIQPGLNPDALLISISFPRYCRQTIEIAELFQNGGARIAAITDSEVSPLAQLSDLVFPLPFWVDSFFESNVAVLSFFNAVLAGVSYLDGHKTMSRLQRLEQIWDDKSVYLNPRAAVPSWAEQLQPKNK